MSDKFDVRINLGAPGHELEAVVNVRGFDHDNMLPRSFERAVADRLAQLRQPCCGNPACRDLACRASELRWYGSNRGSRYEITPTGEQFKSNDRDKHLPVILRAVLPAVADLLGKPLEELKVQTTVFEYVAPAQPRKRCECGCGQELTFRERWEHKKAQAALV